jgi:hypothetical protein
VQRNEPPFCTRFATPGSEGSKLSLGPEDSEQPAQLREHLVVICSVPIGRPFPNVPSHIEESKTVGPERSNGSGADETVFARVLVREVSLESVRLKLALRLEFISPDESLAIQTATRGEFELGFCRQTLPGPLRVGFASS